MRRVVRPAIHGLGSFPMGLLATECLGGSIVFEGASVSHTPDVTLGMSGLCISGMGCHRPSVLWLASSQYSAKCTPRMPPAMRKQGAEERL